MNLKDLKAKSGPNPGGLVKVFIIPAFQVSGIGPVAGGIISQDIQLVAGSRFFVYDFNPGSARLKGTGTGSEGSRFFLNELELAISGEEPDRLQLFNQMINGLFIVIVELPSGSRKLLGNRLCPASCSDTAYDGGSDTGDRNGTTIKFTARSGLPVDYTGAVPLEPVVAPLAVELSGTDVSVSGGADGSIITTVSGGQTPYTFLWNDGSTAQNREGLTAGTYEVTVTDNLGTQAAASVTITEPVVRETAWRAKESTVYCVTA